MLLFIKGIKCSSLITKQDFIIEQTKRFLFHLENNCKNIQSKELKKHIEKVILGDRNGPGWLQYSYFEISSLGTYEIYLSRVFGINNKDDIFTTFAKNITSNKVRNATSQENIILYLRMLLHVPHNMSEKYQQMTNYAIQVTAQFIYNDIFMSNIVTNILRKIVNNCEDKYYDLNEVALFLGQKNYLNKKQNYLINEFIVMIISFAIATKTHNFHMQISLLKKIRAIALDKKDIPNDLKHNEFDTFCQYMKNTKITPEKYQIFIISLQDVMGKYDKMISREDIDFLIEVYTKFSQEQFIFVSIINQLIDLNREIIQNNQLGNILDNIAKDANKN